MWWPQRWRTIPWCEEDGGRRLGGFLQLQGTSNSRVHSFLIVRMSRSITLQPERSLSSTMRHFASSTRSPISGSASLHSARNSP